MNYPENFANYPPSITERRSDSDGNGAVWTPRDALIAMLRRIDSGEAIPDALIVCCRQRKADGSVTTDWVNAAPDVHVSLGLLVHIQHKLLGD